MMAEHEMHIGRPYLQMADGMARMCADVLLGGHLQTVFFYTDEQNGKYLTYDRLDAFVAGLLPIAMKDGTDIRCDGKVSRRLLYQLRRSLIPMLADNLPGYHVIALFAEPADEEIPCEKAVVTGWTGGVDSMFTLMRTLQAEEPGHRLTHLMVSNNGSLETEDNLKAHLDLLGKAENGIAAELGLSVVGIGTNIQDLVTEPFLSVEAYRHAAVVLSMQKLFGTYYHSAAYEFSRLAFEPTNSAYYEAILMDAFQTDCTVFYSAFGAYPRILKLRELADFSLARKYLHPCIHALPERNCGRCGKCVRTMVALYALGRLEQFSDVFDVPWFYAHLDWYIADVLSHRESQHYGEALAAMAQRGLNPSPRAVRLSKIMTASKTVADRNRDFLTEKLTKFRQNG